MTMSEPNMAIRFLHDTFVVEPRQRREERYRDPIARHRRIEMFHFVMLCVLTPVSLILIVALGVSNPWMFLWIVPVGLALTLYWRFSWWHGQTYLRHRSRFW